MAYFPYCRKSGCGFLLFVVAVISLYFDQTETLQLRGGKKDAFFSEVNNDHPHNYSHPNPRDLGALSLREGQNQNIISTIYTETIHTSFPPSTRTVNATETNHPNDLILGLDTSKTLSLRHNTQFNDLQEVVRRKVLTISDQYVPRHLLFKIINFISFYFTRTSTDIDFTLKEKELLASLLDAIGQRVEEYILKNRVVLSTILNKLGKYSLRERVQRSIVFLSSYLEKDNGPKNEMLVVGRQTPFGVVNTVINFVLNALQDPIVLTLLIIFNLWFVFTGLYSVLFGPVYYLLFPTLFGGSETSSSGSGAPVIGIGDSQASSPQFVGTISDFATQPPAVNSSLSGQTSGSTSSNKIEAQCCVEGTKITTPTGIIAPVQPPNPGSVTVVITTPPLPPPTGQAPPPSPTHVPTVPTLTIESGTSTAPPHPLSSVPTPSATSPAPTQRPILTFAPTQVPTTGLGTIGTSTLGSTQDRLGPFVHFSSLLHTCLSLGGSKKACAAQASLYAQVLKVPITNEILQQSLVVYNPKPPIKSVTKPYPETHSKPYLSAKPPSTVHLLPPHGKPFVHYQVSKPSNVFPSYSVSNQYREKVPPLKKREFSKLLTQLNQHPDHWKNIKLRMNEGT